MEENRFKKPVKVLKELAVLREKVKQKKTNQRVVGTVKFLM